MYYFIQILYFITTVSSMSTKIDERSNFNIGFRYFETFASTTKIPPVIEYRVDQNHRLFRTREVEKISENLDQYDSSISLYLQKYIPFHRENVVSRHFENPKLFPSHDIKTTMIPTMRKAQRNTGIYKTTSFTETQDNKPEKDWHRSNNKDKKDSTTVKRQSGRYGSTIFIDTQDNISEKDSLRSNIKKRKDSDIERSHTWKHKSTILNDTEKRETERFGSTIVIDTQDTVSEKDSLRSNIKKRKESATKRSHTWKHKSSVFDTESTITEKDLLRSNKKKRKESTTEKRHRAKYKSTVLINTEDSISEEDAQKNIKENKNENRHRHHDSPKKKRVDHQLKHFNKKTTNIVQNNKNKNEKSEENVKLHNLLFSGHSLYVEPIINHYSVNLSWAKENDTNLLDDNLKILPPFTKHLHRHIGNKTKNHSNFSHRTYIKLSRNITGKWKEENAHKLENNNKTSDKKISKKNINSDSKTQLSTPSVSIEDRENTKSEEWKYIINTTSEIWQPTHKVKEDIKIYNFIKQIFKDKLEILHTAEEKTSDIDWKIRLGEIAKSYESKFKEFTDDIGDQKIRSKSGKQRVLLHSINMSNHLVMKVISFVADEIDRKGILRNNRTFNIITKEIEHKTKSEFKHACAHFGICKRSTGFIDFVISFMTTLLSLSDDKFEKAYNLLTKHILNTDFTNTVGYNADLSLKTKVKEYETMNIMYKRASIEMLRNILAYRNSPIVIYGDNDKIDVTKTLAFIEVIKILEKAVPNSQDNERKWRSLTKELNIYAEGHADNIERTTRDFVLHIKHVVDHTDARSWISLLPHINTLNKN